MPVSHIPFHYFGDHFVVVPCHLDGSVAARLILDTGAGVTALSNSLLNRLGHKPTGRSYTGRRMSGQALSIPLTTVDSISLDGFQRDQLTVGTFDFGDLLTGPQSVDGILSLGVFERDPVTEDHGARSLTIEDEDSMERRVRYGSVVTADVRKDDPSIDVFVKLRLPSDSLALVEVDTGSYDLILHERYMRELGVAQEGPGVKRVDGVDETGHRYVRYSARLEGEISLPEAPTVRQRDPAVIFQDIIYDGLVGHAFLNRYAVTYDLPRARMIFSDPA